VWARRELITRVSQRAEKYDITVEADASSVNGALLADAERSREKVSRRFYVQYTAER
jgi:hypothetical protein